MQTTDCSIFLDRKLKNFCPWNESLFGERHRCWCQQSEDDGRKTPDGSHRRGTAALGRQVIGTWTQPAWNEYHLETVTIWTINHCRYKYWQLSHRLDVPPVRLSTVGKRAFPVSGATVWNDLPLHVAPAPSLAVFRQRLKTFLFSRSYQDTIIWLVCYYHHSSLLSGHVWSLQ